MQQTIKIRRALVSVSDKEGIVELCKVLQEFDIEIVSTGGTKKTLENHDVLVRDIQDFTGNPEAFDGRMKSLSFQVSSSLLFRRDSQKDLEEVRKLNIEPIDLVICNLYPFEKKMLEKETMQELIEDIDVGGPTMLRSAAKNYQFVCALSSVDDYGVFKQNLREGQGAISVELSKILAYKTFSSLSRYDNHIAKKLEEELCEVSGSFSFDIHHSKKLRYGENPHQEAYLYTFQGNDSLATSSKIQGKGLSYNNYLDADAAISTLRDILKISHDEFQYGCCIIKHSNPCGLSLSNNRLEACKNAWRGDPVSAFGSVIALNFDVDKDIASFFNQYFVEVLIAPSFTDKAREILKAKKNLRLIPLTIEKEKQSYTFRSIDGGVLIQQKDFFLEPRYECVTDTKKELEGKQIMAFSQLTTKALKSNAISLCRFDVENGYKLIGAGMGNPNRLVSVKQCFEKALENGENDYSFCVLASDAFFPFRDNIDLISSYGRPVILQPGGSIKDKEVIEACDEYEISMYFSFVRNFSH